MLLVPFFLVPTIATHCISLYVNGLKNLLVGKDDGLT